MIYNKPLIVKDTEGQELYVIKEITLDAELELDNLSFEIAEAREILLNNGEFTQISYEENELSIAYVKELMKENADQELLTKLEKKMAKFDEIRKKRKKRLLTDKHVLYHIQKMNPDFLVRASKWLQNYIEGFEQKSLYDCARELQTVSYTFQQFKKNIKKK